MAKKVLVVEDEPGIVTCLDFLMKQSGYEIQVAGSHGQALKILEGFTPDLILLDIMLPGRSGLELCQTVRENPDWGGMKIIFLTARGRDVDIEKGMAIGGDAYITKPFSTRALVEKVREVLGE